MTQAARLPATTIRVLVVDDSIFMRRTLERMLNEFPGIEVVGTAANGIEGIQKVLELRPDVVTMDVEMPRMDGVSAVGELMRVLPTPVVMLSTLTFEGAETTIRALEAGAVECVAKPGALSRELGGVGEHLAQAVIRASVARPHRQRSAVLLPGAGATGGTTGGAPATQLVVIGSSTGGPPALTAVIPRLPATLQAAVLVVQHMPAGFTAALARRLDGLSAMPVTEATEGDLLLSGRVLVAPGSFHTELSSGLSIHLTSDPTVHGVRPSVDVTLESVARHFSRPVTVAILTGMGRDGADGCALIEERGGMVILQDEVTSVVYGMPRAARERTRHSVEVGIDHIADAIVQAVAAGARR